MTSPTPRETAPVTPAPAPAGVTTPVQRQKALLAAQRAELAHRRTTLQRSYDKLQRELDVVEEAMMELGEDIVALDRLDATLA